MATSSWQDEELTGRLSLRNENNNLSWLPHENMGLRVAATIYAAHGWHVFPCRGKQPVTHSGFKDASADIRKVRSTWSAHGGSNCAWALPSHVVALDVDPKRGGDQSLAELQKKHGPLPLTLRQTTGSGGEHWMFEMPTDIELRQAVDFLPGLDTRIGGKGYIIVSPSIHPETKQRYRWHTAFKPAPCPDYLVEMLRAPEPKKYVPYESPKNLAALTFRSRAAHANLKALAKCVAEAPEGNRHMILFWAWTSSGEYRDVISNDEAASALTTAGLAVGLSEKEIKGVLK